MTINTIKSLLKEATKPVAHVLRKTQHGKVLAIGFREGMHLADHQTKMPTRLLVVEGKITYHQGEINQTLGLFDEYEIPVNTTHAVTANSDSVILLIQG